jgi:hypothetical protein
MPIFQYAQSSSSQLFHQKLAFVSRLEQGVLLEINLSCSIRLKFGTIYDVCLESNLYARITVRLKRGPALYEIRIIRRCLCRSALQRLEIDFVETESRVKPLEPVSMRRSFKLKGGGGNAQEKPAIHERSVSSVKKSRMRYEQAGDHHSSEENMFHLAADCRDHLIDFFDRCPLGIEWTFFMLFASAILLELE